MAGKGGNINPKGKGGFADNPQNRANGRWTKETSISYQYNYLIRLTQKDFDEWEVANPPEIRTVAMDIAYQAVKEAKTELAYLREITDRTEGKPDQAFEHSGGLVITRNIIDGT